MTAYSLLFVLMFCACAFWSLAGLIFPGLLVVASPERRTRGYAFFFPLTAAIFFFGLALFCDPKAQVAGIPLILLGGIPAMLLWRKMKQARRPSTPVATAGTDREGTRPSCDSPAESNRPSCADTQEKKGYGSFENYECYQKALDKALDAASCGKAALDRLDALVEAAPDADHNLLTDAITDCFFQQCESKHPVAAIRLFDKMQQEHPCMDFALQHGGLDEMVNAFCESLNNPLPEKGRTKAILGLLQSEHPLVKGALASSAADIADWLDGECEEILPDWEAGTHDNMPPEVFISELVACLAGEKNPDAISADALPEAGTRMRLPSESQRGLFYDVDLENMTCTCPDWQSRRSTQPVDSPARYCKHLLKGLALYPSAFPPALEDMRPLLESFQADNRGTPCPTSEYSVRYGIYKGIPYALGWQQDSEWSNVFLPGVRYGYSFEQQRWSYGQEPDDADFWIAELASLMNENIVG